MARKQARWRSVPPIFAKKIDLTMVEPHIPGFFIARGLAGKYDVSMNCHAQVVIKESKRCS